MVREILRKFDIYSLQICPPHLSAAATIPWEIQKVIFNDTTNTYMHFWLFTLSRKKGGRGEAPVNYNHQTQLFEKVMEESERVIG